MSVTKVLLLPLLATFSITVHAEAKLLEDCPDKPNCVSSLASDPDRQIAALRYRGKQPDAMMYLLDLLRAKDEVWIVEAEGDYLHVTYTSHMFEFVDDVEFLFEPERIQVRSASRTGYWDMGANRRRIENLREEFEARWFADESI